MDKENKPDRAPQKTPWGEKQFEFYDPELGFTRVETSGHGGIWLDEKQRAQIPDFLKKYSHGGEGQWWEEDCAWSLPTIYFLSKRSGKDPSDHFMAESAKETAREYYPDCYKKLTSQKSLPSKQTVNDARKLTAAVRAARAREKDQDRER
jgi:uncharacterized protein DUF7007